MLYSIPPFMPDIVFKDLLRVFFGEKVKASGLANSINKYLNTDKKWHFSSSGCSSLFLILKSFGAKKGDEIILPAYICPSVIAVAEKMGLTIKYCDIDTRDLNISISALKREVTANTKFILVASLYGNPANIDKIKKEFNNKIIIDDAAQAFGAKLNGKSIGTFGDAGFYSVGPGKPLFGAGGSFFWAKEKNLEQKSQNWLYNLFKYTDFVYNRIGAKTTSAFPLNLIGTALKYKYLFSKRILYAYDQSISEWDLKCLKLLFDKFDINQKKKRYFFNKIKIKLAGIKRLRLLKSPDTAVSTKLVFLCDSLKTRRSLIKRFKKDKIFYYLGYQELRKMVKVTNFPNLKKILDTLVEVPIPRNEFEYNLLKKVLLSFK